MTNIENRFIDIETKLAFQEDTLQELNKIVYQQQLHIDQLERTINRLQERLNADNTILVGDADPANDIPPHY